MTDKAIKAMLNSSHGDTPLARPRKGADDLAPNLYHDARKRPGHYRYRRADGSFRSFTAPTLADANRIAEEANALRHQIAPGKDGKPSPGRDMLAYHAPLYIAYRERLDPSLAGYSTEEIQSLMAHESKTTTLGYQDGHDLPYSRMEMVLPEGVIGGEW